MQVSHAVHTPVPAGFPQRFLGHCAKVNAKSAELSLWREGEEITTTVASNEKLDPSSAAYPMSAGCMAKVLTTIAVLRLFEEKGLSVDTPISELLASFCPTSKLSGLSGISVRHLLNYTHGLDSMGGTALPRCANGMQDLDGLIERFSSLPRLFNPGEYFSLSDVGAMFVGIIVEKITGQVYSQHLRESVYPEVGLDYRLSPSASSEPNVCPTVGGDLYVLPSDLVQIGRYLCEQFKGSKECSLFGKISAEKVPMPGYSLLGLRTGLGIHEYADGWFGHNAGLPDGAMWSWRFHPERSVVIAIGTPDTKAALLMQKMMQECSPADAVLTLPRARNAYAVELASPEDQAAMCGKYETWALSATVQHGAKGLEIVIDNRDSSVVRPVDAPIVGSLLHGEQNSFFINPGASRWLRGGQFVRRAGATQFDFLWSGRRMWRRV